MNLDADLSDTRSLHSYAARRAAVGGTIICFLADGCMAHDHKFRWFGKITGFRTQSRGDPVVLCEVAVLKRADTPSDIRDRAFEPETAIAAYVTRLAHGVYVVLQ